MDKMVKYVIAIGIGIVALSIAYYFLILLPKKEKGDLRKEVDKVEANSYSDEDFKKQSLENFYDNLVAALKNNDLSYQYEIMPQVFRNNISKNEFISSRDSSSQENYFSQNYEVKGMTIDGNKGTVYRTITYCITQECEGENKKIDDGSREYEYVDGKWQLPEPKPSERSLSAATDIYYKLISKSEKSKKEFFKKFSYDKDNPQLAILNYSLFLDDNIETLVLVEKTVTESSSSSGISVPIQIPQISDNQNTAESILDNSKRKREQKCQQDSAEYNSCLAEYNAKMAEYNSCLSKNADPNQTFKPYCSKPFNFCQKPICIY